MNDKEALTVRSLRSILGQAVEQATRADRANISGDADRSGESFPLLDPATLAAMPDRGRSAVTTAARALASLVRDGDSTAALAAVPDAALRLVPSLPLGWEPPKMAPADVEATVDAVLRR
jgi:hypothetical protein